MKILEVEIKDFLSIGEVKLKFPKDKNKLILVTGDNKSGKSNLLSGFIFSIYGKTFKTQPLLSSYSNRITKGSPFLRIKFIVNDDEYVVITDRSKVSLKIFKNGEDISSPRLPDNYKFIKDLLGINYLLFCNLTSVTPLTVNYLQPFLSKTSNIFFSFSDVALLHKLSVYFKDRTTSVAKQRYAYIKASKKMEYILYNNEKHLVNMLNVYIKILKNISSKEKYLGDPFTSPYAKRYKELKSLQKLLVDSLSAHEQLLKQELEKVKIIKDAGDLILAVTSSSFYYYSFVKSHLNKKKEVSQYKVKDLEKNIVDLKTSLIPVVKEIEDIEFKLTDYKIRYLKLRKNIMFKLGVIRGKLSKIYLLEKNKKSILKNYKEIKGLLEEKDIELNTLRFLHTVIKSENFVELFSYTNIKSFNEEISNILKEYIPSLEVTLVLEKEDSLNTRFVYKNIDVPYESFSTSEKVEIMLCMYLAAFKTLKNLSNVTLPFFILDDILGTVKSNNTDLIYTLLQEITKYTNVIVVDNSDKLSRDKYDAIYNVTKENEITKVEESK